MRILYIDIDTLRADHLGCYGYVRNTSPNIDRVAAEGVRFTNYYASDAPCLPSRTALVTGQQGIHSGVVGHGGTGADLRCEQATRAFHDRLKQGSLAGRLREGGLYTAMISPFGERHSCWHFYAGQNEIHNTGKCGTESAEEVTPVVLDWFEKNAAKDDWCLHVNLWDPHTPFRAPEEFGNPFADAPLPEWITDEILDAHWDHPGPHGAQDVSMYSNTENPKYPRQPGEVKGRAGLRKIIDGYDCGIAYADQHVGKYLDALEKLGVLEDTAIIISADHGENYGELGIYAEHGTADQATCNIPLIIRWPGGQNGGQVSKGLHYNIDLAPTLAEMVGQEPSEYWTGKSFAATIKDGTDCGHETLVISQCAHVCQRSVRWGDWLYIRTHHDGYHLFPDEMLFNLKDDPHEQHNLVESHPEIVREGAYRYVQWHDKMMHTMPFGYTSDPLWKVIEEGGPLHARGRLKDYTKRLEESGRGHHIAELKRRHPREFL